MAGPHKDPLGGAMPGYERAEYERRVAAEIEARFPGWEIARTFGGFRAVPRGTPVVEAVDLGGLLIKLERRHDLDGDEYGA